jgi:hypothetical protein
MTAQGRHPVAGFRGQVAGEEVGRDGKMRLLRQLKYTIRVCGLVLRDAAKGFSMRDFLPPLATLAAYPVLLLLGLDMPSAFVIAYALGRALLVWAYTEKGSSGLQSLNVSPWLFPMFHLALIGLVLWLESPDAALRILYLAIALRILMLLLDLSDGNTAVVQKLWPHLDWRAHDAALTRVLILRDIAMILLGETVIFTGSVPLMLALVALWQVLHSFIDRVTATSVLLVGHFSPDR